MMLKLGERIISDLYLGDKRIAKAFLGAKLVYKAKGPIFLDYIESNGVACINTDLKPSYDYTIKIKYQYTSLVQTYNPIFGMRLAAVGTGNGLFWVGMHFNEKRAYLRFGENSVNYAMGDKALDVIEMTCSPEGIFINGEDTGARYFNGEITSEARPICLFTINGESGISASLGETNAKVYSYQVFDGDMNLIQDLRPCLHPKTLKACMYDMVTKKYFYNQGTGTLKAGGRFVESILFDGESYIDTGIIPTDNTGAYIKYTNTGAYLDSVILGYRGEVFSSMRFFLLASYNCSVSIGRGAYAYLKTDGEWGNAQDFSTLNTSTEVWSNYLNSRVVRAKFGDTDITSVEIPEITFTPSGSLFLGAENRNNTDVVNHYKGEIDRCVITEGGTIIQDLRPYVDEDGIPCFYDTVTNVKFYNEGTGTLSYTE